MSSITINIPQKLESYILPKKLEATISELVFEYIETKQDMELKNDLSCDSQFGILNRKIELKL